MIRRVVLFGVLLGLVAGCSFGNYGFTGQITGPGGSYIVDGGFDVQPVITSAATTTLQPTSTPQPTPTQEATCQTTVLVHLNARSYPAVEYPVLGVMVPNTTLTIYARYQQPGGAVWYRFVWDADAPVQYAWASSGNGIYIRDETSCAAVPFQSDPFPTAFVAGGHFIDGANVDNYVRTLPPHPGVMAINNGDVLNRTPGLTIFRTTVFGDGPDQLESPQTEAYNRVNLASQVWRTVNADFYILDNEVVPASYTWYGDYWITAMQTADTLGYKLVLFNFAPGHPPYVSAYDNAVQYAADHGHAIGWHLYGVEPDRAAVDSGEWIFGRPDKFCFWWASRGLDVPPFYVTEYGYGDGRTPVANTLRVDDFVRGFYALQNSCVDGVFYWTYGAPGVWSAHDIQPIWSDVVSSLTLG